MRNSSHGQQGAAPPAGTLIGIGVAAVLLTAAAVALLRPEESTTKALVAVWLWALPVLGIGAGSGWLIGRGVATLGATRHRPETAAGPTTGAAPERVTHPPTEVQPPAQDQAPPPTPGRRRAASDAPVEAARAEGRTGAPHAD